MPLSIEMHKIRKLKNKDLDEVFLISQRVPWGQSWTLEKLTSELIQGFGFVSFHEESGQLSGFLIYRRIPSRVEQIIEISWLATAPLYQCQGVMKRLFQELFVAHGQNAEYWLEVSENNHIAIQFYEKLGFKKTGHRPFYYPDGSAAINMNKKIT